MENEIVVATATYLGIRLAVMAGIAYAVYRVLRSADTAVETAGARSSSKDGGRAFPARHNRAAQAR